MSLVFSDLSYLRCTGLTLLPAPSASKTIFFRCKFSTLSVIQGIVNFTDRLTYAYQFGIASGVFRMWAFGGAPYVSYTPAVNEWLNIAYTYSPGSAKLYENGVLKSTSSATFTLGTVDEAQIGGNQWAEYGKNFAIEDLRVYNRALTEAEVIELSNNTAASDTLMQGLVYWWPLIYGGTELQTNTASSVVLSGAGVAPIIDQRICKPKPRGKRF
jgi:hypothetical protein